MTDSDRFLEDFRRVERADPWWSLVHLAAAVAWVMLLGVTHAGEGVAFGILTAVAAIRLPSTRGLYGKMFRSPTLLAFLAFLAWQAASVAWSANPAVRWYTGISRFTLLPFALWPMAHRTRELAVAFCLSAVLHSAVILGANVRAGRVATYTAAAAGKELGMTAACLLPALLLMLLAERARSLVARSGRGLGTLLVAGAIAVLSQRASFIGLAAGWAAAVAKLMALPSARRRTTWPLAVGAVLLALAALLTPRVRGMAADAWRAASREDIRSADVNQISSGRYSLALVALDMFRDRPMLGWGARSFAAENARRINANPEGYAVPEAVVTRYASLTTSHNAFLDEASMRGVAGIALLSLLGGRMLITGWRSPTEPATLAVIVAWLVFGLFDATTSRGTYLALLGLLVARCAALECMGGAMRQASRRTR